MAKIIWEPKAKQHLREIEAYIEEQDCSEKAMRVSEKIMKAPKKLRNFPELGSIVPLFKKRGFREIRIFKWRIFYTVSEDKQTINIQGIWHGARRLSKDAFGDIAE